MVTFEIYKDVAGYYRWRLKAGNGEIVAASEAYASKQSAIASAQQLKIWAASASIRDLALSL